MRAGTIVHASAERAMRAPQHTTASAPATFSACSNSRPAMLCSDGVLERASTVPSAAPDTPCSLGRSTMSASRSSSRLMLFIMMATVCINSLNESPVGLPSGGEEISIAITISAPISRAKRTGTGDTSPPSTNSRRMACALAMPM